MKSILYEFARIRPITGNGNNSTTTRMVMHSEIRRLSIATIINQGINHLLLFFFTIFIFVIGVRVGHFSKVPNKKMTNYQKIKIDINNKSIK
jgi:mannosyltransferase OCH1-like enzyme